MSVDVVGVAYKYDKKGQKGQNNCFMYWLEHVCGYLNVFN